MDTEKCKPISVIKSADIVAPNAIIEPTDKSIPPAKITYSKPIATSIGPACCNKILRIFMVVKNVSESIALIMMSSNKIINVLLLIKNSFQLNFLAVDVII